MKMMNRNQNVALIEAHAQPSASSRPKTARRRTRRAAARTRPSRTEPPRRRRRADARSSRQPDAAERAAEQPTPPASPRRRRRRRRGVDVHRLVVAGHGAGELRVGRHGQPERCQVKVWCRWGIPGCRADRWARVRRSARSPGPMWKLWSKPALLTSTLNWMVSPGHDRDLSDLRARGRVDPFS